MICKNCGRKSYSNGDLCKECSYLLNHNNHDNFYNDRGPNSKLIIPGVLLLIILVCILLFPFLKSKAGFKGEKFSAISALCDSGPASNVFAGSQTLSDGKDLFFKNPYDTQRLYAMDEAGNIRKVSDISPDSMFYYNGYIYFTGAVNDIDTLGTKGLYRIKPDGKGQELLLSFYIDIGVFELETLYDGKLYFVYKENREAAAEICSLNIETKAIRQLHSIPDNLFDDYAYLNVTKYGIYFQDGEGLKKLNEDNTKTKTIIRGFKAGIFNVYKGYVYYVEKSQDSVPILKKVRLDGENEKSLFEPEEKWANRIKPIVYNDKLFFLVTSDDEKESIQGVLYTCGLDGENLEIVSEKASKISINNDNLYYSYEDSFDIFNYMNYGEKFENLRSNPMYKRSIGSGGSLAAEEIFFDPRPLNRGWQSFDHPSSIYNTSKKDFIETRYYYYDDNGQLYKDGWKNIDGEDYCFANDGHMLCEEFSSDGKFLGKDGKVSGFVAPYKENLIFFEDSSITMVSNSYKDRPEEFSENNVSELIERDEVYELTNMFLESQQIFSAEDVESLKPGHSFSVRGINLVLTVTGYEGYNDKFRGYCVGLKQTRYPNLEFKLAKTHGDNKYALLFNDGTSIKPATVSIYRGSLYFSKDAVYKIFISTSQGLNLMPVQLADYYNRYKEEMKQISGEEDLFYFSAALMDYDRGKEDSKYYIKEVMEIE